jgi:hypothetical protein
MKITSLKLNYKLPSMVIGEEAVAKMLAQSKFEK